MKPADRIRHELDQLERDCEAGWRRVETLQESNLNLRLENEELQEKVDQLKQYLDRCHQTLERQSRRLGRAIHAEEFLRHLMSEDWTPTTEELLNSHVYQRVFSRVILALVYSGLGEYYSGGFRLTDNLNDN